MLGLVLNFSTLCPMSSLVMGLDLARAWTCGTGAGGRMLGHSATWLANPYEIPARVLT